MIPGNKVSTGFFTPAFGLAYASSIFFLQEDKNIVVAIIIYIVLENILFIIIIFKIKNRL